MVIGFGDLRKGVTIEMEGAPYKVEEYYQQKMQQRAPTYHIKLRHLITGQQVEKSFSGYGIKLTRAPVVNRTAQYLYEDGGLYYFMDTTTFEQYAVSQQVLGESIHYLTDQGEMDLVFWRESPITVELPTTVDMVVTETPPSYKGDTASGGGKPATVHTGLKLSVPTFIHAGDKIKVDTRNGTYVERV